MNSNQMPNYDPVAVQPLRDELTAVGFKELKTTEDVKRVLSGENDKVVMVLLNSVCGCAAGSVRPGAVLAVQSDLIPDKLVTLFAGMEKEAVAYYRNQYLSEYMPSSPSIGLFKNGKVIALLQREDLVEKTPEEIATILTGYFANTCTRRGPSISAKEFKNLPNQEPMCGSDVPKFDERTIDN